MNTAMLNNLTTKELLRSVNPQTDLEKILFDLLEDEAGNAAEIERLEDRLSEVEDDFNSSDSKVDDLNEEIEAMKVYGNKLIDALRELDAEHVLLEDELIFD